MKHQSAVLALNLAFWCFDISWLGGNIIFQKILKASFSNKTNAGAVFFVMGNKSMLFCQVSYFLFFQFANRKQGAGNLFCLDGTQEITLILVCIKAFKQECALSGLFFSHIMTGGDQVGTEHGGIFKESLALDFTVIQNVGVGSATGLVFFQEMFKYIVPVFGGEVCTMKFYP